MAGQSSAGIWGDYCGQECFLAAKDAACFDVLGSEVPCPACSHGGFEPKACKERVDRGDAYYCSVKRRAMLFGFQQFENRGAVSGEEPLDGIQPVFAPEALEFALVGVKCEPFDDAALNELGGPVADGWKEIMREDVGCALPANAEVAFGVRVSAVEPAIGEAVLYCLGG